mmetsp:Transcript_33442/g.51342  ORF Transcript_33442/g.51342 Transcript_33442/m.51342 type:complete len:126 (-) Transcript_33442:2445-2822(-)|eukprot:CAMPEP_0170496388 /NCGR_PEP_ID=MMETSP0208-20121228/21317_1 /TAXON_ID=197538 /ORGANISM="Strombidium inclinatum, Strain S3" /LENGTH=125 /DNA_ID=CAMNT_0010772917 /DNA_START=1722 /DNA_END=2099 /DNA_ORIENTATION=-
MINDAENLDLLADLQRPKYSVPRHLVGIVKPIMKEISRAVFTEIDILENEKLETSKKLVDLERRDLKMEDEIKDLKQGLISNQVFFSILEGVVIDETYKVIAGAETGGKFSNVQVEASKMKEELR